MLKYKPFLLLLAIFTCVTVFAQDIPPCSERPFIADLPRVESRLWCIERPIFNRDAGELTFTAIEFAPNGTLYATRPLTGELLALTDTDGDFLPDTPRIIADGLAFPNGLAYADETLYIIGDGHVYQYADETLTTIAR